MNKREILDRIFELSQEEILDICEILNGYKKRINCSKKDTRLMRCMFVAGYHNTTEFTEKNEITKDSTLYKALSNDISNVKVLCELFDILKIDDYNKVRIINELGSESNESKNN